AAIDMQTNLVGYRAKLAAEGRPIVHVRIGVNTGDMVVGNLGSAQRMDYTIMGDAVNLASRLEGANKMYGTRIMISDHVCDVTRDLFEVRELDRIRVVGRTEANNVYELLDRKGELDAAAAELLARYNTALKHYRKRDWHAAIHAFEHTLEHAPEDGPSITYLERCRLYCATPPPPDWDGVFELTEKG
ncbi:MAG: adenylate/guanylate cyclase domain-containing protein, partial [Gammaproteobacteria bacterium]|nr:adenylate/guanylate cyclase domain-containing protein [Gammaproteobacteria bacterium]